MISFVVILHTSTCTERPIAVEFFFWMDGYRISRKHTIIVGSLQEGFTDPGLKQLAL